jgi:hypothetical protein
MFKIKRWSAFALCSLLPVMAYLITEIVSKSFWIALGALGVFSVLTFFIGGAIIKNPFTQMLEGEGLLCGKLDSTGIFQLSILKVSQPYIKGIIDGKPIEDVYDRDCVNYLTCPHEGGKIEVDKEKGLINIQLNEAQFNKARLSMFHYPFLFYNGQISSLITKDFLAEQEKKSFAEHQVLYLNRKMEELTSLMRDFGRYVVELTKPKDSWLNSKWTWIIIIVVIVIFAIMFAKPLMNAISGISLGGGAGSVLGNPNPVVPK